jgi:hypothetical protein
MQTEQEFYCQVIAEDVLLHLMSDPELRGWAAILLTGILEED